MENQTDSFLIGAEAVLEKRNTLVSVLACCIWIKSEKQQGGRLFFLKQENPGGNHPDLFILGRKVNLTETDHPDLGHGPEAILLQTTPKQMLSVGPEPRKDCFSCRFPDPADSEVCNCRVLPEFPASTASLCAAAAGVGVEI